MQPSVLILNISAMSDLDKRMIGLLESAHVCGICANFTVAPQDGNKIRTGFSRQQAKQCRTCVNGNQQLSSKNTVLKTGFSLCLCTIGPISEILKIHKSLKNIAMGTGSSLIFIQFC